MVSTTDLKTAVLTGPTASGKSSLALELACRSESRLEIINADSLLVYRGMDIGTAKPSPAELSRIPHHLIDIRDPDQPFTAGDFVRSVEEALSDIHSRGHPALIVGGSGFYLKALLQRMWEAPPSDPGLRQRIEQSQNAELYARLEKLDSEAALRIGRNDRYRLVRTIEIFEMTGKTPSQLETASETDPRFELWVVDRGPAELGVRISQRTQAMLDSGFIDEVQGLMSRYPNSRALSAVGYAQVCAHLAGIAPSGRKVKAGLEGLREEIELATRQLVKKQRTWFKSQKTARRFLLDGDLKQLEQRFHEVYCSPPANSCP